MHDNRYIRNLVRMYQNAIAEKEKLAQKPQKWEDCKEYFKLWVAHKFFLSKEVSEYITDNIKFGPSWSPKLYKTVQNCTCLVRLSPDQVGRD